MGTAQFIAILILSAFVIYLVAGLLFCIAFQIKGLHKVDEGTHGATIGFRVIIIPGIIVLWPVLLRKWIAAERKK